MKRKSKITHAQLLAEGVVWLPKDDARVKPAALDVVSRPAPKLNVAPKPTDPPAPPKRKLPQGTGLMRSINAAVVAQGGTPIAVRSGEKGETEKEITGLQRSINANVDAAAKALSVKPKSK